MIAEVGILLRTFGNVVNSIESLKKLKKKRQEIIVHNTIARSREYYVSMNPIFAN